MIKKRCDQCYFSTELNKDKNHVQCIRYASNPIKNNDDYCVDYIGIAAKILAVKQEVKN
jgi:hypothetical protein